jgi:molybdopterin molybdotransferase
MAAAAGLDQVPVYRSLRVALATTGDELIAPGSSLPPGKVYNSNHAVLSACLQRCGCTIIDMGNLPDSVTATREALQQSAQAADLIITSGGASVGEEDHIKQALEQVGTMELWRIALRPGKPLVFGHIRQVPYFGLPGNPVSALVTFCLFARPFILQCQGATDVMPRTFTVTADFTCSEPSARRQYLRARVHTTSDRTTATLYPDQGSAILSSASWADGLVIIPEGGTVQAGQAVHFIPFSELLD